MAFVFCAKKYQNTMRTIHLFIAAAMLCTMISCGTARQLPTEEEELTQTWTGKEYNDIVQSFGAPDRVATDGKDGSILIYEDFSSVVESDTRQQDSVFGPRVTTTITNKNEKEYTHFFLNPEGFCYLVKTNRAIPGSARDRYWTKTAWIALGAGTAGLFLISALIASSFD